MSRIPKQVSTTGTRVLAAVRRNTTVLRHGITAGSHAYEAGPRCQPLPAVTLLDWVREKRSR